MNRKSLIALLFCSLVFQQACSHQKRHSHFDTVFEYQKPHGVQRKLADDSEPNTDIQQVDTKFKLFDREGVARDFIVFKNYSDGPIRVYVSKQPGVSCSNNGVVNNESTTSMLIFNTKSADEIHCEYDKKSSSDKVEIDVTYEIAKAKLSWTEINKNHQEIEDSLAELKKENYNEDLVKSLLKLGVVAENRMAIAVEDGLKSMLSLKAQDYLEFARTAEGGVVVDKKQWPNLKKDETIDSKGVSDAKKLKALPAWQKKGFTFSDENPYGLVCSVYENTKKGKKEFERLLKSTHDRISFVNKVGEVFCRINAPTSFTKKSIEGTYYLKVVKVDKNQAVAQLEGLLHSDKKAKLAAEEKIDQKNKERLEQAVTQYMTNNEELVQSYKKQVKIDESIQEEQEQDSKKADHYVDRTTEKKFYKASSQVVLYAVKATENSSQDGKEEKTEEFLDYLIADGSNVYRSIDGASFSESTNIFYPKFDRFRTVDPWKNSYNGKVITINFCAAHEAIMKKKVEELDKKEYTGSELIQTLNNYAIIEDNKCAVKDSASEVPYQKLAITRQSQYTFCYDLTAYEGKEGRKLAMLTHYQPSRIIFYYKSSFPLVDVKLDYLPTKSQVGSQHPFFKNSLDSQVPWALTDNHATVEKCITSKKIDSSIKIKKDGSLEID